VDENTVIVGKAGQLMDVNGHWVRNPLAKLSRELGLNQFTAGLPERGSSPG
jgi:hypothetical protein